ncbi:MAG: glutaredoxin 3 [Candidatus Methylopumilus sp.]|nr:glutaredoxin 3 [Candidatus Methylopumilus sp.]
MKPIKMYTSAYCSYCSNAEKLLSSKGVSHIEKIRVDEDLSILKEMIEKTGRRTVPQIYIGDYHVGGFDDLRALDLKGELDDLLKIS